MPEFLKPGMAITEAEKTGRDIYREIVGRIKSHDHFREHCINLIASENAISPAARAVLKSDLGNRYTVGPVDNRLFPGSKKYDQVEVDAIDMVKDRLGADYVTVQPVSGMVANMVAFYALLEKGDTVLSLKECHGGHYSHHGRGVDAVQRPEEDQKSGDGRNPTGQIPGENDKRAERLLDLYGVTVDYLPFDDGRYNLDMEGARQMILDKKPKLVIVGASEMLFPIPLAKLREICDQTGTTQILYDAAHVAGLIFGKRFQDPLREGADMVTFSTNKSMGGPDHGVVACRTDRPYRAAYPALIQKALKPMFTSNHHANVVASVAVTLAELKEFGEAYADQVIRNSQALAKALKAQGIDVLGSEELGYSQSHTVIADIKRKAKDTTLDLEKANIILNTCTLPTDKDGTDRGFRIGTSEMTRMGMKEPEMEIIAGWIAEVLHDPNSAQKVEKEVGCFRERFQLPQYCFEVEG